MSASDRRSTQEPPGDQPAPCRPRTRANFSEETTIGVIKLTTAGANWRFASLA
jgi:hypothetical protein